MGKINGCLRCLFIFFNVVFAIIGGLLIFGAVKSTAYSSQMSMVGGPSLGWGWLFAIGVLGISCLGIYAGSSEKELALKIFGGFMVVGMIIMMIFGIITVVTRNKVKDALQNSEIIKPFLADEQMRALLDTLQKSVKCCGVASVSDWGDQIPQSCECSSQSGSGSGYGGYGGFGEYGGFGGYGGYGGYGCKPKPADVSGPDQIYEKSCGEFIFMSVNFMLKILMGFFFGFAVTALMGLLVTILMYHQVKRHDSAGGASMAMKSY
ncbi:tetraspanin-8-like [Cottoperca gobio]|uniref:Tetraspanin-8-like n=1 Tax=Cottoperca gobio TaxID=56716 RepID=A0A6J2PCN5_COTGO|nr:tetraspanin-8-like [Cottoperca gobio]